MFVDPEEAIDARIKDVIDSHLRDTGAFEARKIPIMKAFEEFLHSSKQIYINRSLTTAIPDDVIIRFLAFKDVKGGGRMVVHDVNCYNIGEPELLQDCGELGCKTVINGGRFSQNLNNSPFKRGFQETWVTFKMGEYNGHRESS